MNSHDLQTVFTGRPKQTRPRQKVLAELAFHLSLVSQGIRSGYLFDTLTLSDEEAEVLAERLASDGEVVVLKAAGEVSQWFCVNHRLLLAKIHAANYPVWVELGDGVATLPEPPDGLVEMLNDFIEQVEAGASLIKIQDTGPQVVCPLAAFLLDYPFAYVPLGKPDFGGDIVAVELILHGSCQRSFMKFSYPACLDNADTRIAALLDIVQHRISAPWSYAEVKSSHMSSNGIVL